MLDSLLRKDTQRSGYVPPASPQARMQEALATSSPTKPPSEPPKADTPKTDAQPAPATAALPGDESVSRLFVGPDIKMKGAEITDCDTLVVEGRVEAAMDSRNIQISEQGVFVGKAGVDVAEIRGRFEGELTVRKLLVVRSTGHVSGKIRYGKMSIEENGEISGDVAALSSQSSDSAVKASGQGSGQSSISSGSFSQPPKIGASR
jgi:cytoskeletal protein CcmA (bactofilin family)